LSYVTLYRSDVSTPASVVHLVFHTRILSTVYGILKERMKREAFQTSPYARIRICIRYLFCILFVDVLTYAALYLNVYCFLWLDIFQSNITHSVKLTLEKPGLIAIIFRD